MKIQIYGDSIMKGAVLEESGRYSAVMAENIAEFERSFPIEIINRSRFGSTILKGAKLLKSDLSKAPPITHGLIEFGGNDCNFNWQEVAKDPEAEHLPLTPLEDFEQVFTSMVGELKGKNIIPIAMTLPPIDAEKYLHHIGKTADSARVLSWLGDVNMIYRFHEMYSNSIAFMARELNILLIDVRKKFLQDHRFSTFIGADGIHLTRKGYKNLAEIMASFTAGRVAPTLA